MKRGAEGASRSHGNGARGSIADGAGKSGAEGEGRSSRLARLLCTLILLFMAGGCAPWLTGGPARTVDRGSWEAGVGVAWLAPPSVRFWQGIPAPQLWVARGVGSDAEIRLTYAPPLSIDARVKRQIGDGRGDTFSVHAAAGWMSYGGVLDLPLRGIPYGAFGGSWSRQDASGDDGSARVPFVALDGRIPFVRHPNDRTALTVWLTGTAGIEWQSDDLWIAPQLGWIVPMSHPRRWIWLPGATAGVRR